MNSGLLSHRRASGVGFHALHKGGVYAAKFSAPLVPTSATEALLGAQIRHDAPSFVKFLSNIPFSLLKSTIRHNIERSYVYSSANNNN
ncbi:MAG: hypothetical protein ACI9EP_000396 [Oceanospirillaceae bacterium]|jgi:hypothetical protein